MDGLDFGLSEEARAVLKSRGTADMQDGGNILTCIDRLTVYPQEPVW